MEPNTNNNLDNSGGPAEDRLPLNGPDTGSGGGLTDVTPPSSAGPSDVSQPLAPNSLRHDAVRPPLVGSHEQPASAPPAVSSTNTFDTPSANNMPPTVQGGDFSSAPPTQQPQVFTAAPMDVQPVQPGATGFGQPPAGGTAQSFGSAPAPKKSLFKRFKLPIIAAIVLVVLIGGGAAAYFGYYMRSDVVWKQSLGHMNKAYDQLVSYANTQSKTHYKGLVVDGSFTAKGTAGSFDGSLHGQSDSDNATYSLKTNFGVGKVDFEERSVKPKGADQADVYLQVKGLKDLGITDILGPQLIQLDGKWVVIDHNLINDIKQQVVQQTKDSKTPQLTWDDVNSFLKAAGTVNQQYLFTTNKDKAVTKVLKTYGKETVDGRKTYHYKIGFVKEHVKAYAAAMCTAFKQSGLGSYAEKLGGKDEVTSTCKDMQSSANNIKDTDTIDAWADMNTRLIYKIRANDTSTKNPAENFVDLGLNYKGGDSFPFFLSGKLKDSGTNATFALVATLDSKTNSLKLDLNYYASGDSSTTITGKLSFQPTNDKLTISAPKNAQPITKVLDELGLGDSLDYFEQMGAGAQHGTTALPNSMQMF